MWALGSNPALPSPPLKISAICDDKIIPVAKHSDTSSLTLATKRMVQEDAQFEGSLFYTIKFFLKKKNINTNKKAKQTTKNTIKAYKKATLFCFSLQ